MTEPCTTTTTDLMLTLHKWLVGGITATTLMTIGVAVDRLRMLWGDYRKRHRINGDS